MPQRESDPSQKCHHYSDTLLAVALAQLGRLDEAHSAVKAGLALNPSFTVSRARTNWTAMSDDPTHPVQLAPIFEALRKAGLPEH